MEVDRLNAAKTGERAVIVRLNFNCFKFQSKIGSTAEMKWRLLLDNSKTKGIFFGISILVFFFKKNKHPETFNKCYIIELQY